jgi:hypothetical protein
MPSAGFEPANPAVKLLQPARQQGSTLVFITGPAFLLYVYPIAGVERYVASDHTTVRARTHIRTRTRTRTHIHSAGLPRTVFT